jgi:hypothetical protein
MAEAARVLRSGGLYLYDTINRTLRSKLLFIKLFQEWKTTAFMEPNLHDHAMFIRPQENGRAPTCRSPEPRPDRRAGAHHPSTTSNRAAAIPCQGTNHLRRPRPGTAHRRIARHLRSLRRNRRQVLTASTIHPPQRRARRDLTQHNGPRRHASCSAMTSSR